MGRSCSRSACVCLLLVAPARSRSRTRSNKEGLPVFSREPDSVYYITRSRPVIISCAASPVVQINFKCSDQWVSPADHTSLDLVDSHSGQHGLQVSIEVWRADIEEMLERPGGYWCECHAWNSLPHQSQPVTAKTRRATVLAARK